MDIRSGAREDIPALTDIYNHYVATTHYTFDVETFTPEQRAEWFSHYAATGRHRLIVATEAARILGYATSGRWRPKAAYDTSVETTVYVAPDSLGRGIGSALYRRLFEALEREDVHRAYAGIAQPNPESTSFHERFGFTQVALFTEQGRKFDRYWDVAWYEKQL